MTLTIDFSPDEEAWLYVQAERVGLQPADIIKKLVDEHLPPAPASEPDAENQALINLLRSWREEDATDDLQELERRDAETSEFMRNLQASRLTLRSLQQ